MLLARLLPLNQMEQQEMQKFVKEHLQRGTIRELWSPYAANFFLIKKKYNQSRITALSTNGQKRIKMCPC
jgi:hypothetical protein